MSQSRLKPPKITVILHILTATLQVTSDCEGIIDICEVSNINIINSMYTIN